MNENKITYFPQKAPKIPFFDVYWLQYHQKCCATLAFTIFCQKYSYESYISCFYENHDLFGEEMRGNDHII